MMMMMMMIVIIRVIRGDPFGFIQSVRCDCGGGAIISTKSQGGNDFKIGLFGTCTNGRTGSTTAAAASRRGYSERIHGDRRMGRFERGITSSSSGGSNGSTR